jgi:hypothetical protein
VTAPSRLTIVKVQRPVFEGGEDCLGQLLVYAEGRKMMTHIARHPAIMEALGTDAKGHFEAVWSSGREGWTIGARVPDENW